MNNQEKSHCGRLVGRRILITGAASGIGAAAARAFSAEGAKLGLLDRNEDGLARIREELAAHAVMVDVSSEESVKEAVRQMAEKLDGLDGVINAAGIGGTLTPVREMTLENWHQLLGVNLTGPFLVCREALPYLEENAGLSSIVNVASAVALLPLGFGTSGYAASKGGLVALSKAMAGELWPKVRVNAVCPGPVDTPLLPDTIRESVLARSSEIRSNIAEPQELAQAILFLISQESSFITGTAMAVDGGRSFH